MKKNVAYKRKILDDLFDAFTITAGSNYVSLYDAVGHMTRYSKASVELFGLPGEYVPEGSDDWADYVHPEDRTRYTSIMAKLTTGDATTYNLTYRVRLKGGGYGLFRFVGAILRTEDTNVPELVGGVMYNEGLLENTDPITVLRNQYGFMTDLQSVIELQKKAAVLMLGISKLSEINEKYGYGFGNHVLQEIAWSIQEAVGGNGTVYRLDGARFGVMSDQVSAEKLAYIYENIRQKLFDGISVDDSRQSLTLNGSLITAGTNRMNENSVITCLRYAYEESKLRQHGRVVVFDGGSGTENKDLLLMINEIRDCIIHDCRGFSLVYQPVITPDGEQWVGAEALVRWHSDTYGDVEPSVFIPILERDYIFEELGYWILKTAMTAGTRFLEKNDSFILGINIAAAQIEDELFIEELLNISEETGFPLANVSLELTKECRQLDAGLLRETTNRLRAHGARIIIDDFGTGVASIDFLRDLQPEFIKFDMKYIRDIVTNEEDQQIILHMSELAAACGTQVCIKGVENEAIHNIVKQYAVRVLQGYYYSEPVDADTLLEKWV